ncbi:MAG: secretin N-terminal domain-containing protein [Candidatus Sumerlaeaceae bacterium]
MRRDWLGTHVAAVVAVPFVLGLQPAEVVAINAEPAATILAQAAGPGSALPAPADTVPSATAPVKDTGAETATTTSKTIQAVDSAEPAAARDLDGTLPPEDGDVVPPTPDGETPFRIRGDDELPSRATMIENPYLRATSADSSQETGVTAAGQEYGAFVPPSGTKATEIRGQEAGSEMLTILGSDVYNRRVNITTPPDTEVAEVVRLLAERAALNFVYAEGVIRGRVTLNLRDVPLGVALQSLLSAQDLAIIREGANVMRIAPRKDVRPGQIDSRTIYIKLNWVPAEALEKTLADVLGSSGGGTIKAHTESNTLIITDTAPNVALLRDLTTQLDVPEKQVMIEARMVELLIDDGRALGSDVTLERRDRSGNSPFNGTLSSNGPRSGKGDVVSVGPNGQIVIEPGEDALPARPVDTIVSSLLTGSPTSIGFGGVVSIFGRQFDLAAVLDALETRRIVNTLAAPRVITLNNQSANIDIQTEVPYIEAQQGVSQSVTAATVKFKDVGIRLEVLPTITNNGYVRMQLTPEQRIQSGRFSTAAGDVPIIDRRTAVTNVIVKDEDTVVLGGLRQVAASDTKTQVPWIGQTPIIGWFFKRDVKTHTKTDLMLFVTPHIVKSPVLTPAENYKFTRVDAHWDLPDFFFDDSVDQREAHHRWELDHNPRDYYPQTLKLPPPTELLPAESVESTVTETETTLEAPASEGVAPK